MRLPLASFSLGTHFSVFPGFWLSFQCCSSYAFRRPPSPLSPTLPQSPPTFSPRHISVKGYYEMKRSAPWEEAVTISLDDSSESDHEEYKQYKKKRNKINGASENFKDIMSEGTLIRLARMYQDYMKRIPIPSFSGSIVPFTSWQGLAKSLKQLYKQPLHYLTNILLKQWDGERFGSDDEHQPLDAIVHTVKAQTLIWLTEELHRLTVSPYHLAKLWASDPMYHSHIDPL